MRLMPPSYLPGCILGYMPPSYLPGCILGYMPPYYTSLGVYWAICLPMYLGGYILGYMPPYVPSGVHASLLPGCTPLCAERPPGLLEALRTLTFSLFLQFVTEQASLRLTGAPKRPSRFTVGGELFLRNFRHFLTVLTVLAVLGGGGREAGRSRKRGFLSFLLVLTSFSGLF